MGVSEDSESVVSGRAFTRKQSTLPLTIDSISVRARLIAPPNTLRNVKFVHNSQAEDFLSFPLSHL